MESNEVGGPFGDILKIYRKQKKITQRQLAEKLGVHYNTIWAWESGDHLPETRGIVLELAKQLRLNDRETRHLLEASLTTVSPYWNVCYQRNPFFTGRDEILQQLHTILCREKAAALTQSLALSGLGGIGKTQTALEYAYRHAQEYSAIFWINAETSESIIESFSSIADQLHWSENYDPDQSQAVKLVSRWLAEHYDWLLIIDNVENVELVKQFVPATHHGSIVFTTRMQTLGGLAQPLEMERMAVVESVKLLLYRARRLALDKSLDAISAEEYACAQQIAQHLDGLPLAIDQAGAFIEETQCSLSDYLQMYQAYPLTLLGERDGRSEHPTSVVRTFSLAFEKLEQNNPLSVEILHICAFLAPDAIPEKVLTDGASWLGPTMQALAKDRWQFNAAIKPLLAYSLIHRHAETKTVTIHRLVQTVLKETMPEKIQKEWVIRIIQAINQLFPSERATSLPREQWAWCGQLLPHALVCTTLSEQWEDLLPELPAFLLKVADFLRTRAYYVEAESVCQRLLVLCEKKLDPFHPETARCLDSLAVLYGHQGKYAEAEPLFQRALTICDETLGPLHPDTARCLNSLAVLYGHQGKYAEAEPLFQRALATRMQTLGPDHVNIAASINNLATLYRKQGKYAEAEPLYRQSLTICEQELGPTHPNTAASLNNLARLYQAQGKHAEAEPLLQRSLSIREQELGHAHPETARCLNDLAILYYSQRKFTEAESLFQQTLAIREQAFGPSHPEIAECLNDLATLYYDQKRYEQAEPLLQKAQLIAQQTLGMEHPLTQSILQNCAKLAQK